VRIKRYIVIAGLTRNLLQDGTSSLRAKRSNPENREKRYLINNTLCITFSKVLNFGKGCLISGDMDLLAIKQIGTTQIINFKEFENIFQTFPLTAQSITFSKVLNFGKGCQAL